MLEDSSNSRLSVRNRVKVVVMRVSILPLASLERIIGHKNRACITGRMSRRAFRGFRQAETGRICYILVFLEILSDLQMLAAPHKNWCE